MKKKNPNIRSPKQFRGGYVPREPVDESNRVDRKEPEDPERARKRQSLSLGNQSQARPGQRGWSDYNRKKS